MALEAMLELWESKRDLSHLGIEGLKIDSVGHNGGGSDQDGLFIFYITTQRELSDDEKDQIRTYLVADSPFDYGGKEYELTVGRYRVEKE